MTDPPYGCVAFCVNLDDVGFTPQCSGPGSGQRTVYFMNAVEIYVMTTLDGGEHLCTDPGTHYGLDALQHGEYLSPCSAGYPPQVLSSESLDACAPPPPWC